MNFRDNEESVKDPLTRRIQPLWWDPYANKGLGSWTSEYCNLISARSNLVWFSCTRLGYYAYKVVLEGTNHDGVIKHKVIKCVLIEGPHPYSIYTSKIFYYKLPLKSIFRFGLATK